MFRVGGRRKFYHGELETGRDRQARGSGCGAKGGSKLRVRDFKFTSRFCVCASINNITRSRVADMTL